MPLQKKRFLERVDYITSPGYLDGHDSRRKAGLVRGGPAAIITNKCIFRFDETTKEAYLDSVHPGVTVAEIVKEVSWNLKIAAEVKTTELPTEEQVRLIRILDANRIYTGDGLKNLTFDSYIDMLENSYDLIKPLFRATD